MSRPHRFARTYITKIRPFTGAIFLTAYTHLLDQKMRQLLREAAKRRGQRKVDKILKKLLTPEDKGALLLKKWEDD